MVNIFSITNSRVKEYLRATPAAAETEQRVDVDYDVEGTGPTVLLLAGLGYGGWYWRHVRARLLPHCSVVTVDNCGSDGSEKPAGPYTTALLAEDPAAVLDALGRFSTTVVGRSLGGLIAQELAVAPSDLVGCGSQTRMSAPQLESQWSSRRRPP
ncbi:MAG: alpha/beta hydrolase [Myxococcota bacterium]